MRNRTVLEQSQRPSHGFVGQFAEHEWACFNGFCKRDLFYMKDYDQTEEQGNSLLQQTSLFMIHHDNQSVPNAGISDQRLIMGAWIEDGYTDGLAGFKRRSFKVKEDATSWEWRAEVPGSGVQVFTLEDDYTQYMSSDGSGGLVMPPIPA